jgi:exosortase/archaeosortase
MKSLRSINISAALIVLVCFFLPWVQVSCAGAHDTLSGLDLARHEHGTLWFIPVLMGTLLVSGFIRARQEQNVALSLACMLCGLISAYLMNSERLRVNDKSDLISAQLTGWFWLGFISTLAVAVSGLAAALRRQRAP